MASIANDPNGRKRILYVDPVDGSRKTIRLGKASVRTAESFNHRVEKLIEYKVLNQPMDTDLAQWLANLPKGMAKKLAKLGLVSNHLGKESLALGAFIDEYTAGRTDLKPLSVRHLKDARRSLVEYFGEDKLIGDITPGDADDYRRWLLQSLGENTVRRRCGRAKQFFRAAMRKRLITHDPFADMKGCAVKTNKAREYFVDRATAQAVLDACPDAEWRLIFALARYGGLRTPSELMVLRWGDINWERNRFTVRSSKNERHESGVRVVPIFPELRPYLDAVWDEHPESGSEFVITRYRGSNTNLRTQLERILTRAGVKPWPKLFQNLRASRATELAGEYPPHVAAEWLGHSTLIAQKHYWQVTDADFDRATANEKNERQKAAQKTAQQAHAEARNVPQAPLTTNEETPVLPGFATQCDIVYKNSVPPVGLEQGAKSSGKRHFSLYTSAKSDALSANAKNEAIFARFLMDSELAKIAATLANLPTRIRDYVMLLFRNS